MTAEYPYLNLSLRYVHGTKSTTVFSYPSKTKAPKAPFDAARIISKFLNLSEFYVIGCHDGRRFYSFISVDDADHTGARLELTITLDSDVLLPGRTVPRCIGLSEHALCHHRVGNFFEAGDIGATHVIHISIFFLAVFNTLCVNVGHYIA